MEVVVSAERWKGTGEDMVFHDTVVILRQGSRHFFARQDARESKIDVDKLEIVEEIPETFTYAPFPDGLTQAPNPLPENVYIKRVPWISYFPGIGNGCDVLIEEAKIYEKLRLHPHKNIARYYGCLVENGMFHALCIEKYAATLTDRQKDLSAEDKKRIMEDIRSGVAHLHSLGFVHNDLNPTNIMLTDDGTAVVIDFDSCRPAGEPLGIKRATPLWEVDSEYALPENDLQQVDQIERSLFKEPDVESESEPEPESEPESNPTPEQGHEPELKPEHEHEPELVLVDK
ncbi:kinase-like domain-containing protein [Nemania sp. FL0031]|nr:kinase-like domain-containing protein [Nemania sp. FL0031]